MKFCSGICSIQTTGAISGQSRRSLVVVTYNLQMSAQPTFLALGVRSRINVDSAPMTGEPLRGAFAHDDTSESESARAEKKEG